MTEEKTTHPNITKKLKIVRIENKGDDRLVSEKMLKKKKQWCSSLTCWVLYAVLEPALCLSALKHNRPEYSSLLSSTKRRKAKK